jgi:hypothetical protein
MRFLVRFMTMLIISVAAIILFLIVINFALSSFWSAITLSAVLFTIYFLVVRYQKRTK